eukprot:gb/GECG01001781.1/.p1 GENE.gb/GECG01001781.1/~~gb/GECG01001781.1/.p1  ORF type:complete len:378 (+),score=19.16 gb/GECG01001781.1/:1-1134(+)
MEDLPRAQPQFEFDDPAAQEFLPVRWDRHWLFACCSRQGRHQIRQQVLMPTVAKIYVACSALESLFLLALSLYLISVHTSKTTSLYAGLSIYAVLCYFYFVIDSVWNENKFQFIAANVVSVLYTIFIAFESFHQPNDLGEAWHHIRLVAFIGKAVFQVGYIILMPLVYSHFGFVAFHLVGASSTLQRVYVKFQAFNSSLAIDFCAFLFLLILAAFFVEKVTSTEFIVGCVAAILQVVMAIVAWNAINRENKALVVIYCTLAVVQPAYIGYRLYNLYENSALLPRHVTYPQFCVSGSIFILARSLLLFCAWECYHEFGTRLREQISRIQNMQIAMGPPRPWSGAQKKDPYYDSLESPFAYESAEETYTDVGLSSGTPS